MYGLKPIAAYIRAVNTVSKMKIIVKTSSERSLMRSSGFFDFLTIVLLLAQSDATSWYA